MCAVLGSADTATLQPVLTRLLAASAASPRVLIAGVPVVGLVELKALHESGKLKTMLDRAGVRFQPPPNKKIFRQIKLVGKP